MPEGRSWPWKFFPRRGVALSVTFGEPICDDSIKTALTTKTPITKTRSNGFPMEKEQSLSVVSGKTQNELQSLEVSEQGWMGDAIAHKVKADDVPEKADELARETARIRSAVTAVLHREVEALGRRVLGLDTKS